MIKVDPSGTTTKRQIVYLSQTVDKALREIMFLGRKRVMFVEQ